MNLSPYLTFDGTCEAALTFYASVFNAKMGDLHRYEGSPMAEQVAPEFRNRIMHGNVDIGGTVLMGSDATPEHPYQGLNGVSLSISVKTPDEADAVFAKLAEGGTVTMPIAQTFWAQRFGMLTDKFGTPWMVNCDH
ncbi:MAG TPA: VOC family protein [Burkholderiaceae bacterium]